MADGVSFGVYMVKAKIRPRSLIKDSFQTSYQLISL